MDREFSDPTITHHGKFTQHAARSRDARFTPRTRLPDWRSVLLRRPFYPALVGNDIGCGMALWQTDILARKYNADKFEKRLSALDDVAEESWLEENLPSAFAQHPWRSSLGSIGGGNHFAELQQVDQFIDAELFALAGLDAQHLQLLVHSGSRGWGSLFYSGILPRFRIMVCLKAVTTRYGILRNMTMRWRLRVLIAR